jgi:hypothetical protein
MGNERTGAMIGAALRDTPNLGATRRAIAARRISVFAVACALFPMAAPASAQPTVTISPPVVKGEQAGSATPSAVTDQVGAKRLEEDRLFRINRVIVEGFRDPDDRTPRPQVLEQRFATSLNRANPELVAGKVYDGCFYDGSYFSCADPLSSALRNLRHAIR